MRRAIPEGLLGLQAEIPVEKWLSNWRPEALADRVIAADRIEAGYAKKVIDAINEKMGAPSVMMH
jgi:hypothetical protein